MYDMEGKRKKGCTLQIIMFFKSFNNVSIRQRCVFAHLLLQSADLKNAHYILNAASFFFFFKGCMHYVQHSEGMLKYWVWPCFPLLFHVWLPCLPSQAEGRKSSRQKLVTAAIGFFWGGNSHVLTCHHSSLVFLLNWSCNHICEYDKILCIGTIMVSLEVRDFLWFPTRIRPWMHEWMNE